MRNIGQNYFGVFKSPLVRIKNLVSDQAAALWVKVEGLNPGGSIKSRVGLNMILDGERRGLIKKDTVIIEPSSGNTGIGLAMVCAARGYRLIVTIPETSPAWVKDRIQAYGGEVVLTPASTGMKGAIDKAMELAGQESKVFVPQQFKNPANPDVHRYTTAPEILNALGRVPDVFVAGVGTGGTITGIGEAFKSQDPAVRIVAVEPAESPVLSGGKSGPHKIQGIGAGFVPEILNRDILDEVIPVSYEDAHLACQALAKQEGICAGLSSGAAMWATINLAERLGKGKSLVTILPSIGESSLLREPVRNFPDHEADALPMAQARPFLQQRFPFSQRRDFGLRQKAI